MNFEDFYNASKKLHRIVEVAKTASKSHLYSVSAMADGCKEEWSVPMPLQLQSSS